MVRNLYRVKTWSPAPTRSCRKSTGPGEVSLMARTMKGTRGRDTNRPNTDMTMSVQRLAARRPAPTRKPGLKMNQLGVMFSMSSFWFTSS
jgi:hypothetical protein